MTSEVRRGVLKSFDAGSYKATVQVAGSLGVWLGGVSVSRDIGAADLVVGRSVALLFFDPSNPEDAVITAVWD